MLKVMRNWDNVYEDYKVSGMSINAYAKKHNIPPSSAFTQMKKRLVYLSTQNQVNCSLNSRSLKTTLYTHAPAWVHSLTGMFYCYSADSSLT